MRYGQDVKTLANRTRIKEYGNQYVTRSIVISTRYTSGKYMILHHVYHVKSAIYAHLNPIQKHKSAFAWTIILYGKMRKHSNLNCIKNM